MTLLGVQWLKLCHTSNVGTWVPFLVVQLRSHIPRHSQKKVQTSTSVGFSPFIRPALGAWELEPRCLESNAGFTTQQFFVLGK